MKRAFDLLAVLAFSPLAVAAAAAVALVSLAVQGRPVLFSQERAGRNGRPFRMFKFRTMRPGKESDGERLTKFGRFLRSTSLDELPELWNVLKGDMSLVGPRPERMYYIEKIMEYDKRYEYLYQIRPGVTSYATLYNGYTDTMEKMLQRLEYDLYYLEHRSWRFDVSILFKTFCAIVLGKKF